ncbi:MAG TPA: MFS transporter, partial [Actinoplanes sp.]
PLFGRAVPNRYRARAFGVAVSGLCAGQGLAMLGAGFLAGFSAPTAVIAASGVAGTLAVAAVAARWPRPATPEAVASATPEATASATPDAVAESQREMETV